MGHGTLLTRNQRYQICDTIEAGHSQTVAASLAGDRKRGSGQITTGLILQYFPRHRDFATITEQDIQNTMNKISHCPRKWLRMITPSQVVCGINPPVAPAG
jgi:hypothetical protein